MQILEPTMDQFRKSDLRDLMEHQLQPCLSLYMPTYRAGVEVQQNQIRFKNLLNQAAERLGSYGLRQQELQTFLQKAQEQLLERAAFWQRQSDGLAVFIAPDVFRHYRLPLKFEELVIVNDHFYVKPLLKLLQNNGRYFILALSQNQVRLLEGTKYGVEEIDLTGLPTSLAEALQWDDPEKQLQHHTTSRGRQGGERGAPDMAFHGHGVGTDDHKNNLLRFFQSLDRELANFLADERVPLVLAGVEYLFPIYQQANSYRYLLEQGIAGNPEELSDETLHQKSRERVEPIFQKEQSEAIELYKQQAGMQTERVSSDISMILPAAYSGRVSHLFIQRDAEVWGQYDLSHNKVDVHLHRSNESEDLLNTAALNTFQNGGTVYEMEKGKMPDTSVVAAIFRY